MIIIIHAALPFFALRVLSRLNLLDNDFLHVQKAGGIEKYRNVTRVKIRELESAISPELQEVEG
jgi:ABC-type methionine transport system permease subunit